MKKIVLGLIALTAWTFGIAHMAYRMGVDDASKPSGHNDWYA